MGSATDPSSMDAHSLPDAMDPYAKGTLAVPGTVPGGLTSSYVTSDSP